MVLRGQVAVLALVWCAVPACGAEPVEFNRDIRPVLARDCAGCHGGVKQAGGVSLLSRHGAFAAGKSGAVPVVPGAPERSAMLERIRSRDPDEVMPPPKHGPPLSADQIALVERWIAEGAVWSSHWSFVPPVEPPVARVADERWPGVPLDRLVLAELERRGLRPSAEAPPAEWLRRVSFDLTGLPPSVDELRGFLTDHAADPAAARARVVDRLLGAPGFGERWAAVWLDLARYSDTFGFEKDPHRDIWPYRDWVIRAFNADMPFDQFTIEQLAGDLLPNATADQRLATAFHRNTQCNTEGGTDDEEYRVAAVIDRVNTTWTTWQGVTFGCVQCHAHPYDPIAHEDYYRFADLFNHTMDCDQDDDFPRMKVAADPARRDEASALEIRSRQLREQLNAAGAALATSVDGWQPWLPDKFAPSHGKLTALPDGTVVSEGTLPVGNTHRVEGPAVPFTALRLTILPDADDPKKWPERGALVTEFKVHLVDAAGARSQVVMKELFVDRLDNPQEPGPGGNVGGFPKLEGPRWAVFVPAGPMVAPAEGARLEVTMKQGAQTTGNQGTPVRKFRLAMSANPAWTAAVAEEARAQTWRELAEARTALQAIPGILVPVMVARPAGGRETRVFARGNRLTKEDAVKPGLPEVFAPGGGGGVTDRLALARWLVSAENPLAARVWVNRIWGEVFGTGIVRTMEDFGSSGEAPSNQALLDHLALRLRDHHRWSLKGMLREIVLSATYRQTHAAPAEQVAADPENRLLARGPRVRLTAEMVRDQALSAGGLLSARMFGPPVFPPQPPGVWSSVYSGAEWKESAGEDRLRRGIYTYAKRTSGFPGFLTFDAPSRDLCTPRRIASNTPLQALITLNDPAHLEAARGLAARMEAHAPEPRQQLALGLLVATQREGSPAAVAELAALFEDARAAYAGQPELSAQLGPTPEAAARVLVANTILNLDLALNR